MAKAVVDMAFEESDGRTAHEAARRIGLRLGLEIVVLTEHGPGGGWPEVELRGDRAEIDRALREVWGMVDDGEVEIVD